MKFTKLLFSAFLLITSILILNWKGYFQVRYYNVPGRVDISGYLTTNSQTNSFVFLDKELITDTVKEQFSDVHSLTIGRNKKMGIDINVMEYEPLGRLRDNYFVSTSGVVYKSSKDFGDSLVLVNFNDPVTGDNVLSVDQVYFIQKILEEHNVVSIDIVDPFHFIINLGGVSIEVEKDYSNLSSMLDPTLKFLESAKDGGGFSSVIILSNRLVVKE